ncbi:ankyrin repeat domain-containing protein [Nocardioides sp. IC4_145]|uniref:ankyrin repeat domain-containing protein n=1 Tax=Nocardioides sp. IC4_145 TaxID=2714037 RepID=UPI0014092CBD|nr:ankyrin repeat domain-containing protein [Nocardioides sp. IC4_145]NHC24394.1 ankyrin repeat domain-containing protein [Nocardioides sp. IC4_145]
MTDALTDEELAFLQSMFDLAREGDPVLLDHVDAGLPVDLTNSAGDTLLVLAAYHAHAHLVAGLLERGADHARVNDRGQTALGAAVFRKQTDTVVRLLDAGADPALGRQSGLAVAEVFELPEMTVLLRERRA